MKLDFRKMAAWMLVAYMAISIVVCIMTTGNRRWSDLNVNELEIENNITETIEDTTPSDLNEETQETIDITAAEETTTVVEPIKNASNNNKESHENANKVQDNAEVDDSGLINLGRFTLTAYCSCVQCCGQYAINRPVDENGVEIVYGSTGTRLIAGVSIAVDPRVIPYGSNVVINGHTYIAHDTGGAINGNRIDVYFDNHQDALNFGVRYADVYLVAN